MNEFTLQFGPEHGLAGIVTEPLHGRPRSALVLVTAGLLPKSGPYRLYAELARRMARDGIVSLRFDLSGIGDSAPNRSGLSLRARTEREIGAAIEVMLARYALAHVTLGGLCSGAEDSLRAAGADARVRGVVMIDPFAYRTSGWYLRHFLHRGARRALRAIGAYEPLERGGTGATDRPRAVSYTYMERVEARALLQQLLSRDGRAHFVYTAGARERFNHPRQLRAWFPELARDARVTLDHLPRLDHTQLLAQDRSELIETVAGRLREFSRT
jgi:hypothetical protein